MVIAKARIVAGARLDTDVGPVALTADIPAGHKICVRARAAGEPVRRYGQIIGFATVPIAPGEHVHRHNLGAGELTQHFEAAVEARPTRYHSRSEMRTFDGYLRVPTRPSARK